MKALVGAFNQEKALVGAFSVIVKSSGTFGYPSFQALLLTRHGEDEGDPDAVPGRGREGVPVDPDPSVVDIHGLVSPAQTGPGAGQQARRVLQPSVLLMMLI